MIINVKVDDREVTATLRKMLARSQNPEPAMATIAGHMLASVEDNFSAEGRPTKWKALKASTLAARAKAGKSGKILQRTTHLARSITQFHSRTVAGVGTNVEYAAAMNNGAKPHEIKRKKKAPVAGRAKHPGVVARPFMVLTDRVRGDIVALMLQHIASGQ